MDPLLLTHSIHFKGKFFDLPPIYPRVYEFEVYNKKFHTFILNGVKHIAKCYPYDNFILFVEHLRNIYNIKTQPHIRIVTEEDKEYIAFICNPSWKCLKDLKKENLSFYLIHQIKLAFIFNDILQLRNSGEKNIYICNNSIFCDNFKNNTKIQSNVMIYKCIQEKWFNNNIFNELASLFLTCDKDLVDIDNFLYKKIKNCPFYRYDYFVYVQLIIEKTMSYISQSNRL